MLSCDAKGVVMRPEALREQTKRQAASSEHKLRTRLSRGEKRNRKRMAEVAAVYEVAPKVRAPADILPATDEEREVARAGPEAKNKWVCASVTDDAAQVIARMFDEACRCDPDHQRSWVVLVDGNNHQIDTVKKEAKKRDVKVTILVDCVHVLEYLWGSAWCFFTEGDPAAERWVQEKARAVLDGNASTSPPRSGARPPAASSPPTSARTPTTPPTTCWPSDPTSTTRPRSRTGGRSRRA